MELVKSGAYLTESFRDSGIDLSKWQYWLWDSSMKVEAKQGFLNIYGTTSVEKRAFTGLVSRRLYPADATLITEMCMPCDFERGGTYGFVSHLCNRLTGDEVKTLSIPDNNCEVTFGRMDDKLGWFFWWYDQSGGNFHKWVREEEPLRPFSDENSEFRTVRVSYDASTRESKGAILEGDRWIVLGRPVKFLKLFSAIELKIDAQTKNLDLDVRFRNCRLFPNPTNNPLEVYVRKPSLRHVAVVELCDLDDRPLGKSEVNSDGLAVLRLPVEASFPLSGRLGVTLNGEVIDSLEIVKDTVHGIYPGDFYASSGR